MWIDLLLALCLGLTWAWLLVRRKISNSEIRSLTLEVRKLAHDADHDEYWVSDGFAEICRRHGLEIPENKLRPRRVPEVVHQEFPIVPWSENKAEQT